MTFSEMHLMTKVMIIAGCGSIFENIVNFKVALDKNGLFAAQRDMASKLLSDDATALIIADVVRHLAYSAYFFATAILIEFCYRIWQELRRLNLTPKPQRVEVVPAPHIETMNL